MTLTHLDLDRIEGLVGRLRKLSTIDFGGSAAGMAVEAMSEAASDLTAMITRIRELEGALEPFADLFEASMKSAEKRGVDPSKLPDEQVAVSFENVPPLTVGLFRRARTALQRKTS